MTPPISFADWVDWLAIELTFVELYESAPPPLKRELQKTVHRLAVVIGEGRVDAFAAGRKRARPARCCPAPRVDGRAGVRAVFIDIVTNSIGCRTQFINSASSANPLRV